MGGTLAVAFEGKASDVRVIGQSDRSEVVWNRGVSRGSYFTAADVQMMDQYPGDSNAPAVQKHRGEGQDIRQMLSAAVGIVGDDHIALAPLAYR